eukprot:TRINITY_DN3776_c0_g1_i2.p1 TRINITY_DN3776_c0_g1~~TRINITY_DN3776_c0_g1_i2.p1  ORF type:complete len:804 (+),score=156.40 TRINITY_DN3776_c0_g1_i2:158-2569(+)
MNLPKIPLVIVLLGVCMLASICSGFAIRQDLPIDDNSALDLQKADPVDGDTGGDHADDGHGDEHGDEHGGGKLVVFEMHITTFEITVIFTMLYLLAVTVCRLVFHGTLVKWLPESGLVIFLGVIYAGILKLIDPSGGNIPFFEFKEELFFFALIPPIIFEAGYSLHKGLFFSNFWTINLYAILGTLFNTIMIGVFLFLVGEWGLLVVKVDLVECFLFSSLISAVDPVAVLAIFEEIHVHETLYMLVFGESVLNDAVSIVLYKLFLSIYESGGAVDGGTIITAILKFFVIILGGMFFGTVFGLCCSFMTKYTSPISIVEPVVMLMFGYLSFVISEVFRVSGIVAIMFAGIVMSHYTERNISRHSAVTIKYTLKMLASTTEMIVFMYLGISTFAFDHGWDAGFIIFTLIFCAIFRALGTLSLTAWANRHRVIPVPMIDQFILIYGGLRGAIAFALAYIIPSDLEGRPYMVTATLIVILWTVFVQGATIKPLLNYLKVRRAQSHGAPSVSKQVLTRVGTHISKAIRLITGENDTPLLHMWRSLDRTFLRPTFLRDPGNPEAGLIQVWKDFQTHRLANEIDTKPVGHSKKGHSSPHTAHRATKDHEDSAQSDTNSPGVRVNRPVGSTDIEDAFSDTYDGDYTYTHPHRQSTSKLQDDIDVDEFNYGGRQGLESRIKGLRFGKAREKGEKSNKGERTGPLFQTKTQTNQRAPRFLGRPGASASPKGSQRSPRARPDDIELVQIPSTTSSDDVSHEDSPPRSRTLSGREAAAAAPYVVESEHQFNTLHTDDEDDSHPSSPQSDQPPRYY